LKAKLDRAITRESGAGCGGMASPGTRNDRRREQTRRRLVESARILFAERGPEAVPISDITEHADLGFGSFYNHFRSKEEIVDAVAELSLDAMGELIDRTTAGVSDPAVILAAGLRAVVRRAHQEPVWGRSIIQVFSRSHRAAAPLAARARRDLQRGMDEGRFARLPMDELLATIGGALNGVNLNVAEGVLRPDAGDVLAELMLRMLGVAPAEAAVIARLPLPLFEPPESPR
jgi:AcrR family transcriptional regulator